MGFLDRAIKNGISNGISKGIRDAVGKATENIVAPKAEAYANKLAETLNDATKSLNARKAAAEEEEAPAKSKNLASLEASLNRMSAAAERYADAMEQAAGNQEDLAKEWGRKLAGFPMWCFGGHDYSIEEAGQDAYGSPYYFFYAEDCTQEGLDMYVELLKSEGFVRKYRGSDEVLYKDLGGEYLVFGKTDAFGSAPVMSVSFVRTRDRNEILV